ncbi:1245_t:CDS:10 [Paraglomus occultum]|uniref:1245_t:CDS:1 n=1 Tax=Paraglomus occultum TaxID=144539 RepID=A0A9N8VTZ2_9GLOM|nr:1245_t:CDS:10 [Paraglomus occultum]
MTSASDDDTGKTYEAYDSNSSDLNLPTTGTVVPTSPQITALDNPSSTYPSQPDQRNSPSPVKPDLNSGSNSDTDMVDTETPGQGAPDNDIVDETMTDADQDIDITENQTIDDKPPEGLCVECRDQETSYLCENCEENFCEMCYAMIHRTGTRRKHTRKSLKPTSAEANPQVVSNGLKSLTNGNATTAAAIDEAKDYDSETEYIGPDSIENSFSGTQWGDWIEERTQYIPIRLTLDERKCLRLLEAALNVSEYTDKIDIITYSSKSKRIVLQIKELCGILSGLVVASDYKRGQELIADKDYRDNEEFFQSIFEIGRRHKIMNPEKMRDAYGKLMFMLMDAVTPEVQDILPLKLVRPIKTVHSFLKERDALNILHNDLVKIATAEIISEGKSRSKIQQEIREKERAINILSNKYAKPGLLEPEEIRQCLYSIGDNHAYLRANRDCCDRMLGYLNKYFDPRQVEDNYSLAIRAGVHGARLSHSHEMQYYYANQTLALWREIQHEMFKLWTMADHDMLSENNTYRLRDTGQGLNRVQSCFTVSRVMHSILHRAQQKARHWVGSSVIHLGDKNVPNALVFIDKYNQVSRILNPILICLDTIPKLARENEGIGDYIRATFNDVETLKKDILVDFFRYAFDGSGADNFFDAGSCIDGRLTSAWNWCSQIEKKRFFPVFLLTGFVGFDGGDF